MTGGELRSFPNAEARWLFAAALCVAAAGAVWASFAHGIWLDEFWSLWLANPSLPLPAAAAGWLGDPHPFLPNLLYRLVLASGVDSIEAARLLLNLPPLLLLGGGTLLFARRGETPSFHIVLTLLLVSIPGFLDGFANFRSYFWILCWTGLFLHFAYFLLCEDGGRRDLRHILGLVSIAVVLNLHFVNAIVASVLLVLLLWQLRREGHPALASCATAAVLGWLALSAQAALQYPHFRDAQDHSWLPTASSAAVTAFCTMLGLVLLSNPLAAALAVLERPASGRAPREQAFVRMTMTALVAASLLLLVLNAARPLIADRYLTGWQALACAVIAGAAHRPLTRTAGRFRLFAAIAIVAVGTSAALEARIHGWNETRDFVAASVRACPRTRVIAMNPWRLGEFRHSRVAQGEGRVFAFAYGRLARRAGFGVTMLPDQQRMIPVASPCPTLLWVEHAGPGSTVAVALRAAGISYPPGTRLHLFKSRSGFVLVADPAPAGTATLAKAPRLG